MRLIAEQIIARAHEYGVYVHESKELVALLMQVDLDQHIPPALCTPIPQNLIRLQRREHYRVSTPVINPWRCAIPVPSEYGQGFNTESVVLINISAGGIAVIDEKKLLNTTIGLVYKNCRIDIPGAKPIFTSLEVRNSLDQTLPNGKAVRRIGLMFIDLPKAMLTTIQRNITKLEREYNAKATGMV